VAAEHETVINRQDAKIAKRGKMLAYLNHLLLFLGDLGVLAVNTART
jgi:hypothetical protein